MAEARRWAQSRGITVHDELDYLTEFEHVTLARLLLAEGALGKPETLDQARVLLTRLLETEEAHGRMGSVIEIRVLQALAHLAEDDIPAALTALTHALSLAAPEGYVHVFVAEGAPMADLLRCVTQDNVLPYANHLLTFFGEEAPSAPDQTDLLEPLSDRNWTSFACSPPNSPAPKSRISW
ncbi:MAG: hypothetical protein R2873_20535 [Caldilineaceae bacterium]